MKFICLKEGGVIFPKKKTDSGAQARQRSTVGKIFWEIYPARKFSYDVSVHRPCVQTVGVEVGRQDSLWGRFSLAGNRVAALHFATRVFLARNHISEEQRGRE